MNQLASRPYIAIATGDVRLGGPAELTVDVGQALQPGTASAYHTAVQSFINLAAAGGLCGSGLDTVTHAAANILPDPPNSFGQLLKWRFPAIAVDPLAINVLFNLCETIGEAAGLASIQLDSTGADLVPDTAGDEYPGPIALVPFSLEMDLRGRHVGVEIEFKTDPVPEAMKLLREELDGWALVGTLGGFRWAGAKPLDSILVLDEVPTLNGNVLSFELRSTTAHPAAFDSLIGVLSRTARLRMPIEEVRLES